MAPLPDRLRLVAARIKARGAAPSDSPKGYGQFDLSVGASRACSARCLRHQSTIGIRPSKQELVDLTRGGTRAGEARRRDRTWEACRVGWQPTQPQSQP